MLMVRFLHFACSCERRSGQLTASCVPPSGRGNPLGSLLFTSAFGKGEDSDYKQVTESVLFLFLMLLRERRQHK